MATKKQATKPARKAPALRKPDMAPIDAVRNPNFDAAMAQQDYANFMADQRARLASQRGQSNAEDIYNRLNEYNIGLGEPINPQASLAAKQGRQNAEDIYNRLNEYALGINELMRAQPQQAPQPIQTIAGPRSAVQMNPQKMQAFQNFIQQGIQRSNTMNQDTMTNFANMQPGMPTTEPATPSTARPTMPIAGIGMQKSQAKSTRTFAPTKAF